jgi:hypothetical protein
MGKIRVSLEESGFKTKSPVPSCFFFLLFFFFFSPIYTDLSGLGFPENRAIIRGKTP